MAKWMSFEWDENTKSKITKVWTVIANQSNFVLGQIKWHSGWRRYCFFPNPNTLFEQDCLRDIANFIESETTIHKEKRKSEKQNKLKE